MDPHLHIPLIAIAPFAVLLGCIAVLPLVVPEWWEHNRNKAIVSVVLGAPVAYWLIRQAPHALGHSMHEYVSFLSLLGALFVISGGIHVSGDLPATPGRNSILLGIGALLANIIGTTGAAMVMIRLLLRTNSQRKNVEHIPFFFILIVANCAGLLTPMGDPPLFLGYLRGVPFTWTMRLWPIWLVAMAYLLTVFFIVDRRAYARETEASLARDAAEVVPVRVLGWLNVPLLAGVVGAVFLPSPWREVVMLSLAGASVAFGSRPAREKNHFEFGPIIEVAVIFAGIFVTMVPALELLQQKGDSLGLTSPWQFFLVTGGLSSVLDNAPTYLTFLSTAQALGLENEVVGIPNALLTAISCGAVFMGANTYIGNGPNFMVKAISDSAGYPTASFMRHAAIALLVLSPLYAITVVYVTLFA